MFGANEKEMTFWDHLDELRTVFFRIAIAVILLACIAFLNKELLFDIVLAPQRSDFILYRFFNRLAADFSMPSLQVEDFHVELRNSITEMVREWQKKGYVGQDFVDYVNDENIISFPWSMIDKITPRPADSVAAALEQAGVEQMKCIG